MAQRGEMLGAAGSGMACAVVYPGTAPPTSRLLSLAAFGYLLLLVVVVLLYPCSFFYGPDVSGLMDSGDGDQGGEGGSRRRRRHRRQGAGPGASASPASPTASAPSTPPAPPSSPTPWGG
ncbi:hypothetical protein ACQJBY_031673 [Aegilops geniculata]